MLLREAYYSFVVRIWREPREIPDLPDKWRGVVEEVLSGDRSFFLDLEEMTDFIKLRINPEGSTSSTEQK